MPVVFAFLLDCHPRESGGPGQATLQLPWIPAFAGMTFEKVYRTRLPNLALMPARGEGTLQGGLVHQVEGGRVLQRRRLRGVGRWSNSIATGYAAIMLAAERRGPALPEGDPAMTGVVRFIKATLIGGFFVVLPVVLLYLLALKALQLAVKISTPIAAMVPAELSPVKSPLLIAAILIIGASFLVGLAMYSRAARRCGKGLEGAVGGADDSGFRPALLTLPNGAKAFVLIIEEHGDDAATVFLPSAPTPTVGTVQIAARNQLQILNLKGRDMLQVLSHWGIGARGLLEKARANPAAQSEETGRRP